jgi:hypothetical protein
MYLLMYRKPPEHQTDMTKTETLHSILSLKQLAQRIPRWQLEEEAESMPPTVKSWRNAGDTPCRQGYQEEAKL